MIDIDNFIQAQKITWIKRILDPNNKNILNAIYLHRPNKFRRALFFECNFSERDILRNFKENVYFTDALLAWSKVIKRGPIIDFSNEIIWNNLNILVGNNTIYFKTWHQLGIKYTKDIYDYLTKKIYTFDKLKDLYNVPNNDFLKYLSLVQSIPNVWKSHLKHENVLSQSK